VATRPFNASALIAWIGGVATGMTLACAFALLAFAFRNALHVPVGALILAIMFSTIGLPVLLLGAVLGWPLMRLARARALPRPLTDCAIGTLISICAMAEGLILFHRDPNLARGVLGPIWVDAMCAVTSGAIGGAVYWLLAGKPAPPYPAAKAPESAA
jgi:hypothetical protein